MRSRVIRFPSIVSTFLLLAGSAVGQVTYRTVAATGWQAPGTPDGVVFEQFGIPSINEDGRVALRGWLSGPNVGVENEQGIWHENSANQLQLDVRAGQPAAGLPHGVVYLDFNRPAINDLGTLAFNGRVAGQGVTPDNDRGMWRIRESQNPELIARTGDVPPGFPSDVFFDEFGTASGYVSIVPLLADNDVVNYKSWFRGSGITDDNEIALWHFHPNGQHELIARLGDQAPGFPHGHTLSFLGAHYMNADGVFATNASVDTGVPDADTLGTQYRKLPGGALSPIVSKGDPLPNEPLVSHSLFFGPALNDNGLLAFYTTLTGAGVTGSNRDSILQEAGSGELLPVMRSGDPAPGLGGEITYGSTFTPQLCGNDSLIFRTDLRGPGVTSANSLSYWIKQPGMVPMMLAREGEPISTSHPGIVFANMGYSFASNNAGQLAFPSGLAGAGVTDANNSGVFLSTADGQVHLVMRAGDLFDVAEAPGVPNYKSAAQFAFQTNPSNHGEQTGLSCDGDLVVRITFTDGSQAIVSARLVPPCPPDTNNDGTLSPADFGAWIAAFNAQSPECDQNADTLCTPADFGAWITNYNAGCN